MPIWLRVSIVAAIGYASSNAELLSFSQRGARMISKEERRTLKAEATLLRIPIFALAVKGSANLDGIEFRYARRRGDESVEVAIRTERDSQLPYPGPLSRRIHMACLSLVAERGFPFENPLTW